MLVLLSLLACTMDPIDTEGPGLQHTAEPEPVLATLDLRNAVTGAGAQGLEVGFPDGAVTTGADGLAAGEIPAWGSFELTVSGEGYVDHVVFGPAGDEDFGFITYVASQAITTQVLAMLGSSWDAGTGFVVVGVDYAADLSPVEGATVSLSADHGEPFVFAGSSPALGSTIPSGGMGFVSFPSVALGDSEVTVEPPNGVSCVAHPSGGVMPPVPVLADTVTVLAFHCD